MMEGAEPWCLSWIEEKVCDIASEELGISRERVSPASQLVKDLHIDSLDIVSLFLAVEEVFDVAIPDTLEGDSVYKSVFARSSFRLSDLAELVYLAQGTKKVRHNRRWWDRPQVKQPERLVSHSFSQLSGCWVSSSQGPEPLFDWLEEHTPITYRRRSDGMKCVCIPAAEVEIGDDGQEASGDEGPRHLVKLDSFLMDVEPVSTTAYCRFLNSVAEDRLEVLKDWFLLEEEDDRDVHQLIHRCENEWRPLKGTARWPMILVSWFGANAYSLWANGRDWRNYRSEKDFEIETFLPSEAQWEYAARGFRYQNFPWGNEAPSESLIQFGQHRRSATYQAETLLLADVNAPLGMSPFGLHHMAGNVWQWCADWYDPSFYQRQEAVRPNPKNRTPTAIRSERGGSWIGPAHLCRSSYRRGRPPLARGRCLGFRCVSRVEEAKRCV